MRSAAPPAAKVAFLRQPAHFDEPTERVEAVETHMSWVFLTDRHAYKLKKPVRHAFLDFSTVEARRRSCEEELRLNQRLAEGVYLAVVPLADAPAGRFVLGGAGTPVDWLVKMRRLPRERMLDALLARRPLPADEVARLVDRLAAFYRGLPAAEVSPEAYAARLSRDLGTCRQELTRPAYGLPATLIHRTADTLDAFLEREVGLVHGRVRAGRIVEGHGDLRPEHVCLIEPPVVIDCLEFNRDFRIVDVADELAYLEMECARLGDPATGKAILDGCGEALGDRVPRRLACFYAAYRALLRAKLAAWHTHDAPAADTGKWIGRANAYLALAAAYAESGSASSETIEPPS